MDLDCAPLSYPVVLSNNGGQPIGALLPDGTIKWTAMEQRRMDTQEDELWSRIAWIKSHVGASMREALEWLIEDRNRCSRDAEREAARNHALAAEKETWRNRAQDAERKLNMKAGE